MGGHSVGRKGRNHQVRDHRIILIEHFNVDTVAGPSNGLVLLLFTWCGTWNWVFGFVVVRVQQ